MILLKILLAYTLFHLTFGLCTWAAVFGWQRSAMLKNGESLLIGFTVMIFWPKIWRETLKGD